VLVLKRFAGRRPENEMPEAEKTLLGKHVRMAFELKAA